MNLDNISITPIYVQQVFDAVKFNMQGMCTFNNLHFSPRIPDGCRVSKVTDIRCRKVFNPLNVDDPKNLTVDVDTSISGASFLTDGKGDFLRVIGADGTYSERIMYADRADCGESCSRTPVFGTHNVSIFGDVIIELDLILSDCCNNESCYSVYSQATIAQSSQPLLLTNYFEICMPDISDTAFLPRFTELNNSCYKARLATNSCERDIIVDNSGVVAANVLVAICLTCEKKIIAPVQLCVLSKGYYDAPLQQNEICNNFPAIFPSQSGLCSNNSRQSACDKEMSNRPVPKR